MVVAPALMPGPNGYLPEAVMVKLLAFVGRRLVKLFVGLRLMFLL